MIDWISWVLVALLVFFFGKAEFYMGKFEAILEERKETKAQNLFHEHLKTHKRNMAYFAIIFAVFLVREFMLSS